MGIAYTLVLTFLAILNHIEFSSQSKRSHDGDPNSDSYRGGPFPDSTNRDHPPDTSLTLGRHDSTARPRSPADSPLRVRSRSPQIRSASSRFMIPPARIACSNGAVYSLDQLQLFRLTPYMNPDRIFELRRYTFPAIQRIEISLGNNVFAPMPIQEQIVLSTSHSDVFAVLKSYNILVGMYACVGPGGRKRRAKINMGSGLITALTSREIEEIPVGPFRPILLHFNVVRENHNPTN